MVGFRENPGDAGFLVCQPVAVGTGCILIGGDDRLDRLRGRTIGADSRRRGVEIDLLERAAHAVDEARNGASARTDIGGAIDRRSVARQRLWVDLDDVRSGANAFEMIAAVAVGDGVAAIFHHHAHPADAGLAGRFDAARRIDHPADDGHALADRLALDPDERVGSVADIADRADCRDAVERVALRGVGTHLEQIGEGAAGL